MSARRLRSNCEIFRCKKISLPATNHKRNGWEMIHCVLWGVSAYFRGSQEVYSYLEDGLPGLGSVVRITPMKISQESPFEGPTTRSLGDLLTMVIIHQKLNGTFPTNPQVAIQL